MSWCCLDIACRRRGLGVGCVWLGRRFRVVVSCSWFAICVRVVVVPVLWIVFIVGVGFGVGKRPW